MSDWFEVFLWLYVGLVVIFGIAAIIVWYAHWADWWTLILGLAMWGVYAFIYLRIRLNE